MFIAPIALFAYNRLWHLQQTIEALQRNEFADASELYVFSDAPKSESEREKVRSVREYVRTVSGFKKVIVIERDKNLGLAQSIIRGVTEIVSRYERVIVLEDDIITSKYFLKFMNEALELYKDEERVISIHAYIYPVKVKLPETFFLRGADCQGWATWRRGWAMFEPDGKKLLTELQSRKLTREFDFDNSYDFTKMLANQVKGKNYSWAVRWYASAFLRDKLTLYPGESLVHNIGFDSSGTHCGTSNVFVTCASDQPITVKSIPVAEDSHARYAISQFLRSTRYPRARAIVNQMKEMFRLHK